MVDRDSIRPHMDVIASDGERIGKVDEVESNRIKLTKDSSTDGTHHYVDLSDVARVDEHVHLTRTRAAVLGGGTAAAGHRVTHGNKMLWWLLGALVVLGLLFALSQCDRDGDRAGASTDRAEASEVVTPRVAGAPLRSGTLAYELDRFMSSEDGLPRTFTFEQINFDSGTANLREADRSDLDDIARVLAAYPDSRAAIVGYTDAEGPAATNRELGGDRARAVVSALGQRGIVADRLDARTGGEDGPVATNASPGGRLENRRTELIILKR
jgi:outer membrane protein OmpA-like peptidoglycan-associated protein